MAKADDGQLRIYCVCGQKMKVSPEMYGRPGKCIACRQKIRVPLSDEIPEGAREIRLTEHPEFLRRTRIEPIKVVPPPTDEAEPEVAEDNEPDHVSSVPLDVLEPLWKLCSLAHKVERELGLWERYLETAPGTEGEEDRKKLLEIQQRIESARAALDEELRQRLMEAAIELASTQEKIAEAGLSVRVGEVDFWTFHGQVTKLRRRRDCLERRQENLRGWIAVRDPYTAGGYEEIEYAEIPKDKFHVRLGPEMEDSRGLLDWHIETLRQGFARREQAEHMLAQADALMDEGHDGLEERRAEYRAEHNRAGAEIWFCRDRLEQLKRDYSSDIQSVGSQLDLLRGRLQVGEITRRQFNAQEHKLLRMKSDMAKACDVIGRALSANTTHDVPHARGTFLKRLAAPDTTFGRPADCWLAWAVAALMALSVLLPMAGGFSPIRTVFTVNSIGAETYWLLAIPLLTAALLAGIAFIRHRVIRGLSFAGLWVVATPGWALFLARAAKSDTGLGARIQEGGFILWQPGMLLFVVCLMGIAAAAGIALAPVKRFRAVLPVSAAVVLLSLGAILADFAAPARRNGAGTGQQGNVVPPATETVAPETGVGEPGGAGPYRGPRVRPGQQNEARERDPFLDNAETASLVTGRKTQATYTGVLQREGQDQRFLLTISYPNGKTKDLSLELGKEVYRGWKLSEYNPEQKTVTLRNDTETVLVLRRRLPMDLD